MTFDISIIKQSCTVFYFFCILLHLKSSRGPYVWEPLGSSPTPLKLRPEIWLWVSRRRRHGVASFLYQRCRRRNTRCNLSIEYILHIYMWIKTMWIVPNRESDYRDFRPWTMWVFNIFYNVWIGIKTTPLSPPNRLQPMTPSTATAVPSEIWSFCRYWWINLNLQINSQHYIYTSLPIGCENK